MDILRRKRLDDTIFLVLLVSFCVLLGSYMVWLGAVALGGLLCTSLGAVGAAGLGVVAFLFVRYRDDLMR